MRAAELAHPWSGGHDPERFREFPGPRSRVKRSGRKARLNHDHGIRECDEDAIAGQKPRPVRVRGGKGPDHRPRSSRDRIEERSMCRGGASLVAGRRHGPRTSVGIERSLMRRAVDPKRAARNDDRSRRGERAGKTPCKPERLWRRPAGADDRDGARRLDLTAAERQRSGRLVEAAKARRVSWVEGC